MYADDTSIVASNSNKVYLSQVLTEIFDQMYDI